MPGAPSARMPSRLVFRTVSRLAFSCVGKCCLVARIRLNTISDRPTSSPGTSPARNIRSIDCWARNAYMTSPIDGGMIGPITAEHTVRAAANSGLYPRSRIALISIMPNPAQSATAAPDTPANTIDARTFTCASPALKCPTRELAKLKIRSVMPTVFIKLPAMMKKGTAVRDGLRTPSSNCWGMI